MLANRPLVPGIAQKEHTTTHRGYLEIDGPLIDLTSADLTGDA